MTAGVAISAPTSPWRPPYLRTTAGIFGLAFVLAFEYLAVAAIMPRVAAELDGLAWYAVSFSAPMAASVVALAVAGPAVDRRGPGSSLTIGLAVFCLGVVVSGVAPSMPVFLAGRLVQGLGGGVLGVALYVVVAHAYPEALRARVFAVLTAAWVLPALVGPVIAASVAHAVGWRWVFLGVPALAVGAWLLARGTPPRPGGGEQARVRLPAALVAATGVLAVSAGGQRSSPAWPALVAAGLAALVLAGRRLLPPGSWSGGRGLPSVLGARGLIGAAFAAAEVYVPLLLTLGRGLTLAQAGWVLTTGAVTWWGGSWLAAHWRPLADEQARVRIGAGLVGAGIAGFAAIAVPAVPLVVPVISWGIAGLGIGLAFSTLSVLALAHAPAGGEGRTSSALQLNDYLVQSAALALGSVVFAGFAYRDPVGGATLLVGVAAVIGWFALAPAFRLEPARR
jgi:MFS family permease